MYPKPKPRWPILITPELTHLTGSGNYTFFHYTDGSKKLMSHTIKEWQVRLPSFIRIGKGILVAPEHITGWSRDFTTAYVNEQPFVVSQANSPRISARKKNSTDQFSSSFDDHLTQALIFKE